MGPRLLGVLLDHTLEKVLLKLREVSQFSFDVRVLDKPGQSFLAFAAPLLIDFFVHSSVHSVRLLCVPTD